MRSKGVLATNLLQAPKPSVTIPLLLLNGLNKDKEVIAPLFKIRSLGLSLLEIPCFQGQNSLTALPSTSLNKEVIAPLSYLSRLAATGSCPTTTDPPARESISGRFPVVFDSFSSRFFLSFPRILGVPRREKPLLFSGFPLLFFSKKNKGWRVRVSAPKSQRFLRFAIAMPIADPRNRAISEKRESNVALRSKGAMESR